MDRALALDVPHDLGDGVFGRNRDHHVHVIGHQMPLLDLAPLLHRKPAKDFPEMAS
jgi:hypothetical protein